VIDDVEIAQTLVEATAQAARAESLNAEAGAACPTMAIEQPKPGGERLADLALLVVENVEAGGRAQ
jgi:hypothetical protein